MTNEKSLITTDLYSSSFSSLKATMLPLVLIKPKPIMKILAWDLEWSLTKDNYNEYPIIAAGFCDSHGFNQAFLLEDFLIGRTSKKDAEKSLLFKITSIINKYDWSIGFYSTGIRAYNPIKHRMMGRDSDLIQLHRRLKRYNLKSPIYISERTKLPYLVGENNTHTHLDAYKLFTNKVIKASLYNNAYNSYDLDTISRVILGDDKGGKFEGLSGPIFESLINFDEKRHYVFLDAKLLMGCISNNDYELLKVMSSLSNLTGLPFRDVCNSKGVTKIWTPILDDLVQKELSNIDGVNGDESEVLRYDVLSSYYTKEKKWTDSTKIDTETEILEEPNDKEEDDNNDETSIEKDGPRYIGGWVFEDLMPGEYKNVFVFDITSLYPTMIINNNISFETTDCVCCPDNPDAKVSQEIFENNSTINRHLCLKHRGILAKQIVDYMNKRIEYKQKAKDAERINNSEQARECKITSDTYKILINSAYGQLGHKFSKYENVNAAELVTRYGRYSIKKCVEIAEKMFKWNVIYGDTDSIFAINIQKDEIKPFIDACKSQLNVDMDLDKIYDKLLITGAKNYIGVYDKKLVVKGLAGKKSDRCLWVRKAFKQLLEDYKENINPCIRLKEEINKLKTGKISKPEHQLIIFKRLNKNVDEYKVNVVQKLIGQEKNLEEGDTVRYYVKDRTKEENKAYTENVTEASVTEYQKQLFNTVKKVLELLGYDAKKELGIVNTKRISSKLKQKSVSVPAIVSDIVVKVSLKTKAKIKNIRPKTEIEKYQLIQI